MGRKANESQRLIDLIEGLQTGERIIYKRGRTGWMFNEPGYEQFYLWLDRAYRLGWWDFTQRKMWTLGELGTYEYMVQRRKKPAPIRMVW